MNVYAESSAVLAWLLEEPPGHEIGGILRRSEVVTVSDLVVLESHRVLHRLVTLGELEETDLFERRATLSSVAEHWRVLRISPQIVERAQNPFPAEPVRSLDAIHLASALAARSLAADLELLTLDHRVRRVGQQLGFRLQPR